jgi:hypothetical protein
LSGTGSPGQPLSSTTSPRLPYREVEDAAGFLYHVAFVDEGGSFTVSEIWESKEQHDRWFSENVEGVIPGIERQVIKVPAVVTP